MLHLAHNSKFRNSRILKIVLCCGGRQQCRVQHKAHTYVTRLGKTTSTQYRDQEAVCAEAFTFTGGSCIVTQARQAKANQRKPLKAKAMQQICLPMPCCQGTGSLQCCVEGQTPKPADPSWEEQCTLYTNSAFFKEQVLHVVDFTVGRVM